MASADTTSGKLRAGASALGTQFSSYLGPAALAAGSALVAFGAKSVQAFQDTALAAGKFSDATGVAVEDASRWIEIAGDIGISGEQMESSFAKLNRALGQGDLQKWGIDADNATDGFLQVVDALKQIESPTQRALLAQQAFGRGYTQIAELTAMSAEDLRRALDGVSEGQVIDEDELRKARELRESVDQLSDAWESFSLVLGETIAPIVADLADVADGVVNVRDEVEKETGFDLFGNLKDQVGDFFDEFRDPNPPWENIETKLNPAVDETNSLMDDGRRGGSGYFGAIEDGAGAAADAVLEVVDALDVLKGRLDLENDLLDLQDGFDKVKQTAAEAFGAGAEGAADAAAKTRDSQRALNDLKLDIIDYGRNVLELPDSKLTNIIAMIDEGMLEEAERRLAILARNRTASISIITRGGAGYEGGLTGARASGGPVRPGGTYLVGEEGPELLTMGSSAGYVTPHNQLGAAGASGASIVVNLVGSASYEDGQKVVDALVRWQRHNGVLPVRTA
jgi:hypothetical protein